MGTDTTTDLAALRSAAAEQLLSTLEANGGCSDEAADAIGVVLAEMEVLRDRVSELEAGETRTEWRVRDGWAVQMGPAEPYANWAWKRAREYGSAAEVQQRVIRTSPWVPVEDETEESAR